MPHSSTKSRLLSLNTGIIEPLVKLELDSLKLTDHLAIVALSAQPDLAPLVAGWLKSAFDHPPSGTVEDGTARLLLPPDGPEETFILFHANQPVGTASLSHDDLDVRPDLTPWLAGVYVEPGFRNRGFATALMRQVEDYAVSAGVSTLWLYTTTAEPLYRRLGWQRTGTERSDGREVTLMSRSLTMRAAE